MERKTIARDLVGEHWRIRCPGSGPGCYCRFEYLIEFRTDLDNVEVLPLEAAHPITRRWLPSFCEGIERYLNQRMTEGTEIVGLRIFFLLPRDHPIATHHQGVEREAYWFMREVVEPELTPVLTGS